MWKLKNFMKLFIVIIALISYTLIFEWAQNHYLTAIAFWVITLIGVVVLLDNDKL